MRLTPGSRGPGRLRHIMAGALAALGGGGLLWVSSCGDNIEPRTEPRSGKVLGVLSGPTAAVLDSKGDTVYVLAHDQDGLAQLYALPAAGGAPTLVPTSVPLAAPIGLTIDKDDTLYIADPGTDEGGAIYRGTVAGALVPMGTVPVRAPAGIAVSPDGRDVYVTGRDKADGLPGVFKISATGEGVAVAKGAPFSDPAGVAMSNDGVLHVLDATAADSGAGAVIQIVEGKATRLTTTPLAVGFGAGLTASGKTDLLVTGNAAGAAGLFKVLRSGEVVAQDLSGDKLDVNGDPGAIQQGIRNNAWVAVDTATPGKQGGAVLLLTP